MSNLVGRGGANGSATRYLQRDPSVDPEAKAAFALSMKSDPAVRRRLNHIPSVGMGKFDAEYDVDAHQLNVVIRLFLNFIDNKMVHDNTTGRMENRGAWTPEEKADYRARYPGMMRGAWSGFTFACKKPGWEEFAVKTDITVDLMPDGSDRGLAHYVVNLVRGSGQAMVGRQHLRDPSVQPDANFYQNDMVLAKHPPGRAHTIANHEAARIERVLEYSGAKKVKFPNYKFVLPRTAATNLANFSRASEAGRLTNAPLVPIIVRGSQLRRESVWGYGDLAGTRASEVSDEIKTTNPVKQETAPAFGEPQVDIRTDQTFAQTWESDPYASAVHELGHMLGMPDEYVAPGSAVIQDRLRQLIASSDPVKVAEATALITRKGGKGVNPDIAETQHRYALLLEKAGVEIPEFEKQTTSVMSAGSNILPRHQATLWEVLGEITNPTIKPSEWAI